MEKLVVQVPVSFLLDPGYAASAKVVWMGRCLQPTGSRPNLGTVTGLSRHTVQKGLAQAGVGGGVVAGQRGGARVGVAAGLPAGLPAGHRGGARVGVPAALLAERLVGSHAKVLYGLLQATPGFRGPDGKFTYAALCAMTGLGRNTLKRAVHDLVRAGWVQVNQENRLQPISYTLGSPDQARSKAEAARARQRLGRTRNGGESIMQEYLSLLIDSDEFTDNARPGWLVNPQSGERLELDRFYLPQVAFEFNGAQHYRKTGRFTQEEADAQHFRDLLKAGICLYRGIHLVIIHPEDLSLHGIAKKVGNLMPLRSLEGHEALIDVLEEASLLYRAAAPAR